MSNYCHVALVGLIPIVDVSEPVMSHKCLDMLTHPLRLKVIPSFSNNSFCLTLSKILCKWKQDSAVSLFLYLDSVFKNKHKLIHNQAPVMNRLCPFLLNLHK